LRRDHRLRVDVAFEPELREGDELVAAEDLAPLARLLVRRRDDRALLAGDLRDPGYLQGGADTADADAAGAAIPVGVDAPEAAAEVREGDLADARTALRRQ